MKTYLITYELTFQDSSSYYTNLVARIKSFEYWARPVKSVWLIKSNHTRQTIMDHLRPTIFPSDKLLIMAVTDDWISINLSKEVTDWMQGGL